VPFLSVQHDGRERIGRNDSAHVSLSNSSSSMRTTTLFFVFLALLLAGCASDRSSEQHPSDKGIFETPDASSLH